MDVCNQRLQVAEEVLSPVLVLMGQHNLLAMIWSSEQFPSDRFHIAHPLDSTLQISYRHFVITRPGEGVRPRHRRVGPIPELTSDSDDIRTFPKRLSDLAFQEKTNFTGEASRYCGKLA